MDRTVCGACWALYDDEGNCKCLPASKPRWQGLTDAELREAYMAVSGNEWCLGGIANAESFYEVIEAKLKEKNHDPA